MKKILFVFMFWTFLVLPHLSSACPVCGSGTVYWFEWQCMANYEWELVQVGTQTWGSCGSRGDVDGRMNDDCTVSSRSVGGGSTNTTSQCSYSTEGCTEPPTVGCEDPRPEANDSDNEVYDGDDDDASVCGNGDVELGESCDDGNTTDGDGCSATCRREWSSAEQETYAPSLLPGIATSP